VPFFRLNPHLDYDREFGRCVERGFMGLKLHPVSQEFELDDPRVVRLFGMAAEIELPVLIHAGFAMQRIVEPLLPTVEAHPGLRLILGHSAMVEVLSAARAFKGHHNVLFETSVVQAKDLYELCCSIDPSRICYGSDIPYGDLPSTLHAILAAAETAGVPDSALAGILSENIRRWFP
jgi:predicted TIM-barrel fold metal-dependent hydrolase